LEREVTGMRTVDIIKAKRDGRALSKDELRYFIGGFTKGEIPDYQVSALLMAVYFNGMNAEETAALTLAMADSGDRVDLSAIGGTKVDKHSTGGVGDKTTLVIAPIAAACGIKVAKMSGRGLGHTGGTIDKLESIPGLRTSIEREEFLDIVNRVGLCVIGQSGDLAPADKKLYALRDVTATVDSVPLIAASIMSKKIAAGSDRILLDVKTGSGSFMKTVEQAKALAEVMVSIGKHNNRRTMALITNMDAPLGNAVGNSLEVAEAVDTLKGKGPADLTEVCLLLASHMLYLADTGPMDRCEALAREALASGAALKCLIKMVEAQGGDPAYIEDTGKFAKAKYCRPVKATRSGYIVSTDTERCGVASALLGAGRAKKEDAIDYSAGILLQYKNGDYVKEGEPLALMFADKENLFDAAAFELANALKIGGEPPARAEILLGRVEG